MELLSATASIFAILQLSSEVGKYIYEVAGATKQRIRLRAEIFACESILLDLQDRAEDANGGAVWADKIKALQGPDTPLYRLGATLGAVKAKLKPKTGFSKATSALKWPFDKKEVDKLISAIQREKTLLNLALTINLGKLIETIQQSSAEQGSQLMELIHQMKDKSTKDGVQFKKLNTILVEIQASQGQPILDWITSMNYASHQSIFINKRQTGTGQWLLDSEQFHSWVETKKQTLFCPGIPGAGKTILTSIVVEELTTRFADNNNIGIAYLYFNIQQQLEKNAGDFLASLLKQLTQRRPSPPKAVESLYNMHKAMQTRPLFDELSATLQSVASLYSRVFIVIDALDECQTSGDCQQRFLTEVLTLQDTCEVNIFATSRPIPEIKNRFKEIIPLEIRASPEDVRTYIDGHISHLPSFVGRSPDLQEEIKAEIIKAVDGMFLLARLHLESLIGKRSPKAVRTSLAVLEKGLEAYDHAYEQSMDRIEGQRDDQKMLAKEVLSWITFAKRPLTTTELQHALAVEVGQGELDMSNRSEVEDMVSVCVGLVTVDEESNLIRLAHYTMQEYFERTCYRWFPEAELDIARICVAYLSYNIFEGGFCKTDTEFENRLKSNPLYDYAARSWGHHAHKASNLSRISDSILDLLQNGRRVSASAQAMMVYQSYLGSSQDVPKDMAGVHVAAYFGLLDAIMKLREKGYDLGPTDSYGRTPLSWAAQRGNENVVKLLIENGADINSKATATFINGCTPLWFAAQNGHTAAVKMLLAEDGIELDSKILDGQTPLSRAARNGHAAVVKLLLMKGADYSSNDNEGRTPLNWAAKNRHKDVVEAIVKLLRERSAAVEAKRDNARY